MACTCFITELVTYLYICVREIQLGMFYAAAITYVPQAHLTVIIDIIVKTISVPWYV